MIHFARLLFVAFVLTLTSGCGESDVAPKTELTDKDKQQIEELNQQRVDEWGNKAK